MGNQSPKPTQQNTPQTVCLPEAIPFGVFQMSVIDVKDKPVENLTDKPGVYYHKEALKDVSFSLEQQTRQPTSYQVKKVSESVKKIIQLPDAKPPAKKHFMVKKTKQYKENNAADYQVEDLSNVTTVKSQYIEEPIYNRGKTAPLVKNDQNTVLEFGKTKKCRVSRML